MQEQVFTIEPIGQTIHLRQEGAAWYLVFDRERVSGAQAVEKLREVYPKARGLGLVFVKNTVRFGDFMGLQVHLPECVAASELCGCPECLSRLGRPLRARHDARGLGPRRDADRHVRGGGMTPRSHTAAIEERRRAEARYEAALARLPGAPRLRTLQENAAGIRIVLLDGEQVGYVANSGERRPSWRGILGHELETIVTNAPRMNDARRAICVEHLRRLERAGTKSVGTKGS